MAKISSQTIEWHKECLKNWHQIFLQKEASLSRLQVEVDRMKSEIDFYGTQIDEAIDRGTEAFDRDRFLKVTLEASSSILKGG